MSLKTNRFPVLSILVLILLFIYQGSMFGQKPKQQFFYNKGITVYMTVGSTTHYSIYSINSDSTYQLYHISFRGYKLDKKYIAQKVTKADEREKGTWKLNKKQLTLCNEDQTETKFIWNKLGLKRKGSLIYRKLKKPRDPAPFTISTSFDN